MDIMGMEVGTRIKNVRSGATYVLGRYVNDVAREIILENYAATDYINKNTQSDYMVIQDDGKEVG